MSVVHLTTYTLDELPALIERLRHEESLPEETERLQQLVRRVDRLRAKLPKSEAPVDEWIHEAREESLVD